MQCSINNMTLPYELSATSVQSSKVTSPHLTWCMQCFSLPYKVLGVCVCVFVCVCVREIQMSLLGNVIRSQCFVGASMLMCLCWRIWTRPGVQRRIRLVVHQIIKYVTGERVAKITFLKTTNKTSAAITAVVLSSECNVIRLVTSILHKQQIYLQSKQKYIIHNKRIVTTFRTTDDSLWDLHWVRMYSVVCVRVTDLFWLALLVLLSR